MADAALILPASLDSGAAGALRQQLLERRGASLALDGSAVERLGGLCLQVLLAAAQGWAMDKKSFGLVNMSEALGLGLTRMGAHDLLAWRDRGDA